MQQPHHRLAVGKPKEGMMVGERERELSSSCCFQADDADGGRGHGRNRSKRRGEEEKKGEGRRGSVLEGTLNTKYPQQRLLVQRCPSAQLGPCAATGRLEPS